MDAKVMLRQNMDMGLFVLQQYVSDLTDAELMQRPGPGCNHLAWQIGHLISSEVGLVNAIAPGRGAELPVGFVEAHAKDMAGVDDPAKFLTKQEYLDLYAMVRTATWSVVESLSDADFERPSPERMQKMFPKVSNILTLIAAHPLMHAGQAVPLRRKLGKPVLI